MSKFNNQILNRAVSIKNLSQNNMNQFEHVHLTINQFKSLYLNSKKINEISSDLIELEKYLVHYQNDIDEAQGHEATTERINQASHASSRVALHKSKAVQKSRSHPAQSSPKRNKHQSRVTRNPQSSPAKRTDTKHTHAWYRLLIRAIERVLDDFFGNPNSKHSQKGF